MFYLDTSVLVSVLTNEPRSGEVETWLASRELGKLVISDWIVTEFSSALSIKVRTGAIRKQQRSAIVAQFTKLATETFRVFPVEASAFRTAARFCDQSQLNLRASDALHLAICAENGATICTLDKDLDRAAPVVGVASLLI